MLSTNPKTILAFVLLIAGLLGVGGKAEAATAYAISLQSTNEKEQTAATEAVRRAHINWKISKAKYEAGTISIGQFELARATFELVKVARELHETRFKEFMAGKVTVDSVLTASELLLKAELRVASQKAEVEFFYQAHLKETQTAEKVCKAKYDAGTISEGQYLLCTYHRIEAEIMLDEAEEGSDAERLRWRVAATQEWFGLLND